MESFVEDMALCCMQLGVPKRSLGSHQPNQKAISPRPHPSSAWRWPSFRASGLLVYSIHVKMLWWWVVLSTLFQRFLDLRSSEFQVLNFHILLPFLTSFFFCVQLLQALFVVAQRATRLVYLGNLNERPRYALVPGRMCDLGEPWCLSWPNLNRFT